MVRSIMMLGVVAAVLVGAGILRVSWNKDTGSATVSLDKKKAKEAAAKIFDEAKELEANLESRPDHSTK